MTKFLKVILIIFLSFIAAVAILCATFFVMTARTKLDENKLINYSGSVSIYDGQGEEIVNTSVNGRKNTVQLTNLSEDTKNAFIASEDRSFYTHNGLNYKRMAKALFKNITSRSFKEGASTISQQLIKNTHLTGDKTINRKLKEIRLTKQLEKRYSKDDILEMYLNTIYFGHNCYGLGNAAKFYFDERAEDLSLEQSATLAGLLTSPNNLSPFKNETACLKKRNSVLKSMLDCGFISQDEYSFAISQPISAEKNDGRSQYGGYLSQVYDELDDLGFDLYYLTDGCKINTFLDADIQKYLDEISVECDISAVITDISSGGVTAYRSTINGTKRQPGSTIKPLLVYAPALEEKIICPSTKINDEKINYNGYSPENYDKKYNGYVSVTECLKRSLNVPAVKILNSLTIEKAEKYANKLGIELENEEKNLSLALGGMKHGMTLKEICDCYSAFPSLGEKTTSNFIKNIEDKNGKIIYSAEPEKKQVFCQSTAALMNDMLIETSKSGTAKKLKDLQFDVAAKTGTCGNKDGNYDAYSITYTSQNVVGLWLGTADNTPQQITGGGDCTEINKQILNKLYKTSAPLSLDTTSGTKEIEIDRQEYNEGNKIVIADEICPKLNKITIKCAENNIPKDKSTKYSVPVINKPQIQVIENKICILLCQTEYYDYIVKRQANNENALIYEGKWTDKIYDEVDCGSYIYSVTPYYSSGGKKYFGATITLPQVLIEEFKNNAQELPDIVKRDWYNE